MELLANVKGFSSGSKSFIFSSSIAIIQSIKLFYCISYSSSYKKKECIAVLYQHSTKAQILV
jgi:hypothetical protein